MLWAFPIQSAVAVPPRRDFAGALHSAAYRSLILVAISIVILIEGPWRSTEMTIEIATKIQHREFSRDVRLLNACSLL